MLTADKCRLYTFMKQSIGKCQTAHNMARTDLYRCISSEGHASHHSVRACKRTQRPANGNTRFCQSSFGPRRSLLGKMKHAGSRHCCRSTVHHRVYHVLVRTRSAGSNYRDVDSVNDCFHQAKVITLHGSIPINGGN